MGKCQFLCFLALPPRYESKGVSAWMSECHFCHLGTRYSCLKYVICVSLFPLFSSLYLCHRILFLSHQRGHPGSLWGSSHWGSPTGLAPRGLAIWSLAGITDVGLTCRWWAAGPSSHCSCPFKAPLPWGCRRVPCLWDFLFALLLLLNALHGRAYV